MEQKPSSPLTPPAPGLVKRIKVPVKRPAVPAAQPAGAPVPRPPQPGVKMVKVPVKRIKVPVAKAPAAVPPAAPAPRPPQAAVPPRPAAPIPPAPAVKVPPPPRPNYIEPEPEAKKKPLQVRRSAARYVPIVYELPEDLLDRIDARETIPEKFFLFYLYARSLAEFNAKRDGYDFPEMLIDIPKDVREAVELIDDVDKDVYEAILDDLVEMTPFIPELERVTESNMPLEKAMQLELQKIQKMGKPSAGQKIAIAYMMIMADMQAISYKLEMRQIEEEEEDTIDEIKSIEEEEKEMKRAFTEAIKRKNFPVDAEKLVRNYFSLAKKDPDKAYQTLITNPLFFSPIQMERLPSRFFGLVKPGPKDAIAVNKKLASFLKNLKA